MNQFLREIIEDIAFVGSLGLRLLIIMTFYALACSVALVIGTVTYKLLFP